MGVVVTQTRGKICSMGSLLVFSIAYTAGLSVRSSYTVMFTSDNYFDSTVNCLHNHLLRMSTFQLGVFTWLFNLWCKICYSRYNVRTAAFTTWHICKASTFSALTMSVEWQEGYLVCKQESLAVASIARDDPSTLPGDASFHRACKQHGDCNAW